MTDITNSFDQQVGKSSHLVPTGAQMIRLPASERPRLVVVVDCEEEFDWKFPVQGVPFSTESLQKIEWLQEFFRDRGVVPTYVMDYPFVQSAKTLSFLIDELAAEACVVGAHLHPWVNPPYGEERNSANSYPGNLPVALEASKLELLTRVISERFGVRPTIYKAGRHGIGAESANVLQSLGYEIDLSVVPFWDFSPGGGPDFRRCLAEPYWFGSGLRLLEIPMTAGFIGVVSGLGPWLYPYLESELGRVLHLPGMFSRSRLVNRVKLSPEGIPLREAVRLTRTLFELGQRVFSLTFHSSSLNSGKSIYVKNSAQLAGLYHWLDRYCDFFFDELGGRSVTPYHVLALARQSGR